MFRYIIMAEPGRIYGTDSEETADIHFGEGADVIDRVDCKVMGPNGWEEIHESYIDEEYLEDEEEDEDEDDDE